MWIVSPSANMPRNEPSVTATSPRPTFAHFGRKNFISDLNFYTPSSRADTARTRRVCSGQRSLPLRSASAPSDWRARRCPIMDVGVVASG
jgi:hypothetical protein